MIELLHNLFPLHRSRHRRRDVAHRRRAVLRLLTRCGKLSLHQPAFTTACAGVRCRTARLAAAAAALAAQRVVVVHRVAGTDNANKQRFDTTYPQHLALVTPPIPAVQYVSVVEAVNSAERAQSGALGPAALLCVTGLLLFGFFVASATSNIVRVSGMHQGLTELQRMTH